MLFSKNKTTKKYNESGFQTLKDFLDYLQANKIKYKCIIDNEGNWCASVGGQSVKRYLNEQKEEKQQDEQQESD